MATLTRYRDEFANLPAEDPQEAAGDERVMLMRAVEALAVHAVEQRDERMAGRCLAAWTLLGFQPYALWDMHSWMLQVPPIRSGADMIRLKATNDPREAARRFYLSGTRRRQTRLLRAEGRGVLAACRWLARMGILDVTTLNVALNRPYRRAVGAGATESL